jgi:Protein of unknown function (DUF2806)
MELPGEKLLVRLWETLAEKGIGSLLSPWQTIREGKARNEVRKHELLLLAQAEFDAADVRAGRKQFQSDGRLLRLSAPGEGPTSVLLAQDGRVEPTLDFDSLAQASASSRAAEGARREINVSKAVIFAEDTLVGDPQTPPERAVDADWLFTWRDLAGRVSSEDLQRLWGSVLAGEIKSPGLYSIRTLDFLRALSREEAEQISMLARFAVEGRIFRGQKTHLEAHDITFDFLLRMQELGVVTGVEGTGIKTTFGTQAAGKFLRVLRSHGKVLVVENEDASKKLELEVYLLTSVGAQLLALGSFSPDLEYMRQIGRAIVAQGFEVLLADWRQVSERGGEYFNQSGLEA